MNDELADTTPPDARDHLREAVTLLGYASQQWGRSDPRVLAGWLDRAARKIHDARKELPCPDVSS